MREAIDAYIGLGANLGDPAATVAAAIRALRRLPDTTFVTASSLYRSAPIDASGPDYVNAVAKVRTRLTALKLLDELQALEVAAGRDRPYPNAPRTLDLDLLLYGQASITCERLVVPHPRMRERAFVLAPLAEIAPPLVAPAELAAMTSQVIARMP